MYRLLSELRSGEGAPMNVQQTRLSLLSYEKRMLTVAGRPADASAVSFSWEPCKLL